MRIPEEKNQMSQQRRWKRPIAERARRFVGAVARRHYLSIAAVVLAIAACVTLAPRALSDAASTPTAAATALPTATSTVGPSTPVDDGGLTYTTNNDLTETTTNPPGDPNPKDATCYLDSTAIVSSPNSELTQVDNSINDEQDVGINQDGIGDLTALGDPTDPTGTSMQVDGNAEVDCSLVNQADAYLKQAGYGSLDHFAHAVLDAYRHPAAPGSRPVLLAYAAQWFKNAVAAIVGAVTYIAVSSIVAAAMVALGASLGPGGALAAPVLAAFAGCVGGAVSTAVTLTIAGAAKTWMATLGGAVAGCVTGAITAVLPIAKVGAWLGNAIRTALGFAPAPIVGTGITAAAAGAAGGAVELSPISEALQITSQRFLTNP